MESAWVVGEAVVDVVRADGQEAVRRPGGSGVNTAVALARLGRPVRLATSYAADDGGRLLAAHLAASGVELVGDPITSSTTSRADAVVGADGSASYEFAVEWPLPPVEASGARIVHVTSLAPLLEPGAESVRELIEQVRGGSFISYDLNLRPAITGTGAEVVARVRQMAASSDLLKASDEDLVALWPGRSWHVSARHLLEVGADAVVVTHGADGASWHGGLGERYRSFEVPGMATAVVDTIGAGDTFSAALLDHLWPSVDAPSAWPAALEYAVRVAAVTVSRVGADPPYRHELGSVRDQQADHQHHRQ